MGPPRQNWKHAETLAWLRWDQGAFHHPFRKYHVTIAVKWQLVVYLCLMDPWRHWFHFVGLCPHWNQKPPSCHSLLVGEIPHKRCGWNLGFISGDTLGWRINDFEFHHPPMRPIPLRSLFRMQNFWMSKHRLGMFPILVPDIIEMGARNIDLRCFWPWFQISTK